MSFSEVRNDGIQKWQQSPKASQLQKSPGTSSFARVGAGSEKTDTSRLILISGDSFGKIDSAHKAIDGITIRYDVSEDLSEGVQSTAEEVKSTASEALSPKAMTGSVSSQVIEKSEEDSKAKAMTGSASSYAFEEELDDDSDNNEIMNPRQFAEQSPLKESVAITPQLAASDTAGIERLVHGSYKLKEPSGKAIDTLLKDVQAIRTSDVEVKEQLPVLKSRLQDLETAKNEGPRIRFPWGRAKKTAKFNQQIDGAIKSLKSNISFLEGAELKASFSKNLQSNGTVLSAQKNLRDSSIAESAINYSVLTPTDEKTEKTVKALTHALTELPKNEDSFLLQQTNLLKKEFGKPKTDFFNALAKEGFITHEQAAEITTRINKIVDEGSNIRKQLIVPNLGEGESNAAASIASFISTFDEKTLTNYIHSLSDMISLSNFLTGINSTLDKSMEGKVDGNGKKLQHPLLSTFFSKFKDSFASAAIGPVQRAPRYEMKFKELAGILEKIPGAEPIAEAVNKRLELTKALLSVVNKRDHEWVKT